MELSWAVHGAEHKCWSGSLSVVLKAHGSSLVSLSMVLIICGRSWLKLGSVSLSVVLNTLEHTMLWCYCPWCWTNVLIWFFVPVRGAERKSHRADLGLFGCASQILFCSSGSMILSCLYFYFWTRKCSLDSTWFWQTDFWFVPLSISEALTLVSSFPLLVSFSGATEL